jgi:hypothetical protein
MELSLTVGQENGDSNDFKVGELLGRLFFRRLCQCSGQLPYSRQVMVVMLRNKIQMVYQPHWLL